MKYFFFMCFILGSHICFGQKENNIWCFGNNCGLDFNGGAPVSFPGVAMQQHEGTSSIADSNGHLLLYTDGISVWNKNHLVMANGTGLWGGASSSQSGLIVKQPGNSNIYYIFTTAHFNKPEGFSYSIVDISQNGGLGAVTSKNTQLFTTAAEKVCATKHSNGIDVWITGHEMGTNNFRSYLLTSTGLSTVPVISSIGSVYTASNNYVIGYMKFSHDGKRIAAAINWMDLCELFDFNNTSGTIVNLVVSIPSEPAGVYGVEFSADNTKLYISDSHISQFDISGGNAATILASKDSVGITDGALQIGPDRKIYGARFSSNALDVINSPNLGGSACNFVASALPLVGGVSRIGLPGFISGLFNLTPSVHFLSSDSTFCDEGGKCIDFTDLSTNSPASWNWYFPGATPDTSTLQNPTNICYYIPGTYAVKLVATNSSGSDSLNVSSQIVFSTGAQKPTFNFSGDTIFSSHAVSYQWNYNGSPIPGATDSFYVALIDGNYSVYITDENGCSRLSDGIIFTLSKEFGSQRGIEIYPNPVRNEFFISGFASSIDALVEVYNSTGEEVYSDMMTKKDQIVVNCKYFPSGLYFVRVSSANYIIVEKLMIE